MIYHDTTIKLSDVTQYNSVNLPLVSTLCEVYALIKNKYGVTLKMWNEYEFRAIIKGSLMSRLYEAQMEYWNLRLKKLSQKNAQSFGRSDDDNYAIYFENRKWKAEFLDWTDNESTMFCLPLNPECPELKEDMEEIALQFGNLREEKYEADRFLAGLMLFRVPARAFRKILGSTLYTACKPHMENAVDSATGRPYYEVEWDEGTKKSLITYMKKNMRIVRAMQERVLFNLITITAHANV